MELWSEKILSGFQSIFLFGKTQESVTKEKKMS